KPAITVTRPNGSPPRVMRATTPSPAMAISRQPNAKRASQYWGDERASMPGDEGSDSMGRRERRGWFVFGAVPEWCGDDRRRRRGPEPAPEVARRRSAGARDARRTRPPLGRGAGARAPWRRAAAAVRDPRRRAGSDAARAAVLTAFSVR